ncbi:MAG TPA: MaoC family dehydratase N-terminal domain-containing protein [Actinomycetota bacterium]|jgi:acyl dehydratase|nr:MaoC family dehydratase N-terminal domain-containing protein [Actinomycetota bacterium]
MALNTALIGKTYGEIDYVVDRDAVNRFVDAIGEQDPIYRDPEAAKAAGYAEQVAPPTFITVIQIQTSGQVVLDQELGLDYSRVVHGEQAYHYERPLVVGDHLRATPRLADIVAKKSNEFLTITSEVHDAATGELLLTTRSTLISRGTGGA